MTLFVHFGLRHIFCLRGVNVLLCIHRVLQPNPPCFIKDLGRNWRKKSSNGCLFKLSLENFRESLRGKGRTQRFIQNSLMASSDTAVKGYTKQEGQLNLTGTSREKKMAGGNMGNFKLGQWSNSSEVWNEDRGRRSKRNWWLTSFSQASRFLPIFCPIPFPYTAPLFPSSLSFSFA